MLIGGKIMKRLDQINRDTILRRLWGNLLLPVVWVKEPSQWAPTYSTEHKGVSYKVCEGEVEVFIEDIGRVHTFYLFPLTVLWWQVRKMKRYVDQRERDIFNEEVERIL